MRDFVKEVKEFNEIAGTHEVFDKRKAALYVGLILEEVQEILDSLNIYDIEYLQNNSIATLSNEFKNGNLDYAFDGLTKEQRVEFLDGVVDTAVVAIGAGIAIGGDIEGACLAVSENNLSKFPFVDGQRTVLKDENGKVRKPDGYTSVKLDSYIYE